MPKSWGTEIAKGRCRENAQDNAIPPFRNPRMARWTDGEVPVCGGTMLRSHAMIIFLFFFFCFSGGETEKASLRRDGLAGKSASVGCGVLMLLASLRALSHVSFHLL